MTRASIPKVFAGNDKLAQQVCNLLPASPDYYPVENGGHFAYLASCNEILERAAPEMCEDSPGLDCIAFLATAASR